VSAEFVGLRVVEVPNPFGLRVFDLYAEFDLNSDFVYAVAGTPECPLEISIVGGTFFQHPFGGDLPPNSTLFGAFPDLEFDTFVTIGRTADDSATTLSPGWPGFGPSTLAGNNFGWFITGADPQGAAGADHQVLLGRFSTVDGSGIEGAISISMLVNGGTPQTLCLPLVLPANDDCAEATLITAGSYAGSTLGATDDSASTCGGSDASPDVWYRYVAPSNGRLRVDTCGSSFDTVLTLHSACGASGTCSADCSGEPCGAPGACLDTLIVAGTERLIRVAGQDGASGDFVLHVSFQSSPANDDCADALSVSEGTYAFDSSAAFSSPPPMPPSCIDAPGGGMGADLWYRYTATCSGMVTASLCGSSFDTGLIVYNAICPTTGSPMLACNDDFCGQQSQVTFAVTAGAEYSIRIGAASGFGGTGTLTITGPQAVNDDCGDATPIIDGTYTFDTCPATSAGPLELNCSVTPIARDIWFRYALPRTGDVTVSLCGSSFDTFLAVYGATCPNALGSAIACNDDFCGQQSELTFAGTAGHQYLIRVGGGSPGAFGSGVLTVSSAEKCLGDLDHSGQVDLVDLVLMLSEYGRTCP
jgi:hypothetical protein